MKVYSLKADFDNYDVCHVDYDYCAKFHSFGENELLISFDGTSKKDGWWPRRMFRENEKKLGDYISKIGSDVIIMRKKSIEMLEPVMGNIEVLPLDCDFGDYWAINVLDVLDCIDYEKSKFKRFPQTPTNPNPRIMLFEEFAFVKEAIQGHHVFKIKDQPKSHMFVDDLFVEMVERNAISGMKFIPVWEE